MEQLSKITNEDLSIGSQETSSLTNRRPTLREGQVTNFKSNWKSISKRARSKRQPYMKISHVNLQRLKLLYSKNIYPNKADFMAYSKELGIPAIKIENWFKHRRRSQLSKGVILPPPPIQEMLDPSKITPLSDNLLKDHKKLEEISNNFQKASFRAKLTSDYFEAKSSVISGNNEIGSQDSNGGTQKGSDGTHYKHLIWISGPEIKEGPTGQSETESASIQNLRPNEDETMPIVAEKARKISAAREKSHVEFEAHHDKITEFQEPLDIGCIKQLDEEPFIAPPSGHIYDEQQRHIDFLSDRLYEMEQELRDLLLENHYLKNALARERGLPKTKLPSYHYRSQPSSFWNNSPSGHCLVTNYIPFQQQSPQHNYYTEIEVEKPIDT